ncbi:hypothetical protein L1887_00988 [Cichorium endivia]|nr:hypothetical protein L1887_00988 [Cichorium endivia]
MNPSKRTATYTRSADGSYSKAVMVRMWSVWRWRRRVEEVADGGDEQEAVVDSGDELEVAVGEGDDDEVVEEDEGGGDVAEVVVDGGVLV